MTNKGPRPPIDNLDIRDAITLKQNILRFDVSVNNLLFCSVRQGFHALTGKRFNLIQRQSLKIILNKISVEVALQKIFNKKQMGAKLSAIQ